VLAVPVRMAPTCAAALVGLGAASAARAVAVGEAGRLHRRLRPPEPRRAPRFLDRPPAGVVRLLGEGGAVIDPVGAWRVGLGGGAAAIVTAFWIGGPALVLLAAVVSIAASVVAMRWARLEAGRRLTAAVPLLLDEVARGLRTGAGLHLAIAQAAERVPEPLGCDLRQLVARASRGRCLSDALDGWAADRDTPGIGLAVAALTLGLETGGAEARGIDGVAATVRDRLALDAEARALSAQARCSAVVLVLAPLGFGVLTAASSHDAAEFLFRSPLGFGCLLGGLALDAAAAGWMALLVRRAR
jgi:tight adherence protein B